MNSRLMVPVAFIVAGLAIALGLIYSNADNKKDIATEDTLGIIPGLLPDDHFLGNPRAPIVLVEYSDYDCVFCAGYFKNLERLVEEYGKDGKLLWIHRQMPLYQIHPDSKNKAIAAECVGDLVGEDAFWEFSREIYKNTSLGKDSDLNLLAVNSGVDSASFKECVADPELAKKIEDQYNEAFEAGARGTPFTVIIHGEKRIPILQSLPYGELKNVIDSLLFSS